MRTLTRRINLIRAFVDLRQFRKASLLHVPIHHGYLGGDPTNLGDALMFQAAEELIGKGLLQRFHESLLVESLLQVISLGGPPYFSSLVLGGGTLINRVALPKIQFCLRKGLRVWSLGTGVGSWGLGQDDVQEDPSYWTAVLAEFVGVGVRGPCSQQALETSGIRNSEVVGDLALYFARANPIPPWDPPTFACNLIRSSNTELSASRESWYPGMLTAARELRMKGWRPVFVAMDAGDIDPIREFQRDLGTEEPIRLPRRLEDFFALIEGCRFSVGLRLHLAILSACAGVPSALFGYGRKHLDFMCSIEREAWHIPILTASRDTVTTAIESMAQIPDTERAALVRKASMYKDKLHNYVERMVRACTTGSEPKIQMTRHPVF